MAGTDYNKMTGDNKAWVLASLAATALLICLIGWGSLNTHTKHKFDLACLDHGKTIQYRVLEGQTSSVKECK